jgi:hypothetical protein
MNSVLQCLFSLAPLAAFIVDSRCVFIPAVYVTGMKAFQLPPSTHPPP